MGRMGRIGRNGTEGWPAGRTRRRVAQEAASEPRPFAQTALMADPQSAGAGPAVHFNGSLFAMPATASVAASLLV